MPTTDRDARFADPSVGVEPRLLRPAAVLSALRRGRCRSSPRRDATRSSAARRSSPSAQLVDALAPTNFLLGNPTALKRAFETGGASVVRGVSRFVDDVATQRRLAAAGGHDRVRARQGPRGDAGQGRLPQPADGADPVRAADGDGVRDADPVQPAVDQQVLRHGPRAGKELRRVGDRPRPHRLLHQLPQPRRVVPRRRLRGLPARRAARRRSTSSRRSRARSRSTSSRSASARTLGGDHARPPRAARRPGAARVRSATLLNALVDFSRAGAARRTSSTRGRSRGSSRGWRSKGYLDGERDGRARSTSCARTTSSGATSRASWLMGEDPPTFDILAVERGRDPHARARCTRSTSAGCTSRTGSPPAR